MAKTKILLTRDSTNRTKGQIVGPYPLVRYHAGNRRAGLGWTANSRRERKQSGSKRLKAAEVDCKMSGSSADTYLSS